MRCRDVFGWNEDAMPEPPKLDYRTPRDEQKPKSRPFQKGVGLAGFLLYSLLALAFDLTLVRVLLSGRRLPPLPMLVIVGGIGGFCTWRAIAGFMQFLR
jgi:hypothetical protein